MHCYVLAYRINRSSSKIGLFNEKPHFLYASCLIKNTRNIPDRVAPLSARSDTGNPPEVTGSYSIDAPAQFTRPANTKAHKIHRKVPFAFLLRLFFGFPLGLVLPEHKETSNRKPIYLLPLFSLY